MQEKDKFRIEWSCRRGMLELDKVIMPFYQQHFDKLSNAQQTTFLRLLTCSDLQLFSWFFNKKPADDAELQNLIYLIQSKIAN